MPNKFSHFIFIITFIISLAIILTLSIYDANKSYHNQITKLHQKGLKKLDNQLSQISHDISIITNYSKSLAKVSTSLSSYDEETVAKLFKDLYIKEIGLFQLRLLDKSGMELIRYDLKEDDTVVKSHTLQDKSSRYYYQEATDLKLGEMYISKLDLNEEHGHIQIPHKKTTRVVQKIEIDNKIFYIVANYDLTILLNTTLSSILYELFFIEKNKEINMHLDDKYAFSQQQSKNLFLNDFIDTKEEYISQKKVKFLPYEMVISIKKSQIEMLKSERVKSIQKVALTALLIALIISALLYYFLEKHLKILIIHVLNSMKHQKSNTPLHFQEFKDIVEKVERQQEIIQKNLLALNAQKDFTYSILDSQSNMILITDGKVLKDTNKAMLDFFNYPSLQAFSLEHHCLCDFFIPEKGYLVKENHGKTWLDVVVKDITKTHKVMMKDHAGNKHIFQIFTRNLQDNKNNFVLSLSDITELTMLQTSLEEKVATQVGKLREKEQQLIQQSRLAQMGEMISMIAHQWRQPLSAISATTGNLSFKLMMDDIDKKDFTEEIGLIENYTQHLSKTIDDFREFFKENKEKELISLDAIVESTLTIAKVSAENKDITIKTDLNAQVQLETFASELKQVLLNLIKNAEDALLEHKPSNPTIMIKTSIDKHLYTLTIKDNAGGIPDDIIEKIFDPYFSTKLEKDGTGLGLYMSKTIIEEHCNGELLVHNDKEGAIFTIRIRGVL